MLAIMGTRKSLKCSLNRTLVWMCLTRYVADNMLTIITDAGCFECSKAPLRYILRPSLVMRR